MQDYLLTILQSIKIKINYINSIKYASHTYASCGINNGNGYLLG